MFTKIRQLRISLAAKCQILFGAAVVSIIGAALSVPWHRMEELTEQLNLRAASALADNAVAEHIALESEGVHDRAVMRQTAIDSTTSTSRPGISRSKAERPADGPAVSLGSAHTRMPRLVSLTSHLGTSSSDKFDRHAIAHFAHTPDSLYFFAYYNRPDGTRGYRYAQPLRLDSESCLGCHVTVVQQRRNQEIARTATMPALTPSDPDLAANMSPRVSAARVTAPIALEIDPDSRNARFVGIVSVEFGSRIDTTQLLLNRAFILMAGLLAGILAFFTFYFITTRLILQPVRVLQETAEKVSQGDLNIRSDISTGDEFQQLSETFNTMLANLEQNEDALRAVNKSLDLRLGQLAETNVGLYESNRLKSEFLANVSHELRTPLTQFLDSRTC